MSEEETKSESALHNNIRVKGNNSYYYAHKPREDLMIGPWDGRAEPKLLKTAVKSNATELSTVPITNYAWADSKGKVTLYVKMNAIGQHANEDIELEWTESSLLLLIKNFHGKNYLLKLSLYESIEEAFIKKKENEVVIIAKKGKEITWHQLKKTTS